MRKVRLAGRVNGKNDPHRQDRAKLLYRLFSEGWNIYNSNGDQQISLSNIERKLIEADAFVFTPGATLEDMFKAVSIFVGYQTQDKNLENKPTVLLDSDNSWQGFRNLLSHLQEMGTVRQNVEDYLLEAREVDEVIAHLREAGSNGVPNVTRVHNGAHADSSFETPLPTGHRGNVCVFCSATIDDPLYLADGYELGRALAEERFGCVSDAGKSGVMGEVVRGSVEAGGWTGGSNVPHIMNLEGVPEGLSSFWLTPDIYTRMKVMIERSDAFVIFPGGAGTVQEMLALMIFKQQGLKGMTNKPVLIFDRKDEKERRFWTPLVELLGDWCKKDEFLIVDELGEILPTLDRKLSLNVL